MKVRNIIIIGYSGHALVLLDIFDNMKRKVTGYCENVENKINYHDLKYFGKEDSKMALSELKKNDYFIAIGNNLIRKKVQAKLLGYGLKHAINAIDTTAIISPNAEIGKGVMIAPNCVINANSKIGDGVVCNTSSVIEHEVEIGSYSFIAPNTTLLGASKIGKNCFIGANAVILQGVTVGKNCVIGAGTIVLKDVPENSKVVGNPQRLL